MNPDGSGKTTLTSASASELAVDDSRVYFHVFEESIQSVCK